jgi:hypothetical protein
MSEETKVTPAGKRSMVFALTKQRSKGLTKVIKTVFFPDYKYDKLRGPREHGTLKFKSARSRGKTIDRQLSKCVGHQLTKLQPRATNETKLILDFIKSKGYYIETAQQPVGFAPWRLATSLDLVLRPLNPDETNEDHRVVVEVKRGCLYRRCSVPGVMSQRLEPNVAVSPLHMHQLQAVIGTELLRRTDPSLPVQSMLLYVETELEAIEDFAVKFSATTETVLLATAQLCAGRKQKTVKKRKHTTKKNTTKTTKKRQKVVKK